jgi:hypothetical protein
MSAVLRIRYVYPGSRIRFFSISDPDFFPSRIPIFSIPDTGSASKNLSILTQKNCFLSSRKYDPGCSSRIRILTFYPPRIPDPGVKKAPDPESGSATLYVRKCFSTPRNKIVQEFSNALIRIAAVNCLQICIGRRKA